MTRSIAAGAWLGLVLTGAAAAAGGGVNATLIGQWNGFSGPYADVWGAGAYAYVGHFGGGRVDIIDISDPANPQRAVEYVLAPPNASASAQDVKVAEGLLFIGLEGSGNSVHIVDVRDPTNPVPLVDVAIAGMTQIHNVFYDRGYLYLADSGTPRVGIVDLTNFDPNNPPATPITTTKWMVENVGTSFVHDVTVVNDRMYASAWDSGIWIYDVADLASQPPQFLGSGPGENTHSSWPTDDGRFVVTGEERNGGGIIVYRIVENPGPSVTLQITDSVALPTSQASSVHNQTVIGHRVYNSWYGAGLGVYDIDPVTGLLEFVASYDTTSAWGVYPFLGPDRVLLSDMAEGLLILSVGAPCPADVNGDGGVDVLDLLAVLAAWGPCPGCPEDVNEDGVVDVLDLLELLSAWGPCP